MKDKQWAIEQFSKAFLKYMPVPSAKLMLKAKLSNIDDEEWDKVLDFVNSLSFPLTIYRGLKVDNINEINLNDIGVNWTVDDTLFFAPNSAFKNSNYIIQAVITEDDVDWAETIQNFVYYSMRPKYGMYPESEITLKKTCKLHDIRVLQKEGMKLVPVQGELSEGLKKQLFETFGIPMSELIAEAKERGVTSGDLFSGFDGYVNPDVFFNKITQGTQDSYKSSPEQRINLNGENNEFYKVLMGYLDSAGNGNKNYPKLEPAQVRLIDGTKKWEAVDGRHRAKLCSMLGIKLPVKIIK